MLVWDPVAGRYDADATPEFGTYVGKLWTLLREEASRGMVEAEAAIAGT